MKNKRFKKLSTILIILLLIALMIAVAIKLGKKPDSEQNQQDDVIAMFDADHVYSDGNDTQKTNPNDDGFGTEVEM